MRVCLRWAACLLVACYTEMCCLLACLLLLHKHTPVCSASLWMTGNETMKPEHKVGNCRWKGGGGVVGGRRGGGRWWWWVDGGSGAGRCE